jgi:integrase/recombinase XerD
MTARAIVDVVEFERGLDAFPLKYKFIFRVLIDTGFRISDVLNLKVRDIHRGKNITEKKTKKKRALVIPNALKLQLLSYAAAARLRGEDFLFPSTKGNLCRPVSRTMVYNVFRGVSRALSLDGVISPHSCRKTYAKAKYAIHGDIKMLMADFNHSNKNTTRGYLL